MKKIKILIADDHDMMRDGIKSLLKEERNIEIIAEAKTGEEALGIVQTEKVDVVIMDIDMPDMNGIEATERITDLYPDMKVLVLTAHNEKPYIKRILKAGAKGYVLKDDSHAELVKAINKVMNEESHFSGKVASTMMQQFVTDKTGKSQDIEELSEREIEILQLIADGLSNKDIAKKLFLSIRTIDAHRRNILGKLNLHKTAEAVKYAYQKGLII